MDNVQHKDVVGTFLIKLLPKTPAIIKVNTELTADLRLQNFSSASAIKSTYNESGPSASSVPKHQQLVLPIGGIVITPDSK